MAKPRVRYRQEWVRCGKPNCRCTRGEKHGPYWYANWTDAEGRRRKRYLGKKRRKVTAPELSAPPRPVRLPGGRGGPKPLSSSLLKSERQKSRSPNIVRADSPTRDLRRANNGSLPKPTQSKAGRTSPRSLADSSRPKSPRSKVTVALRSRRHPAHAEPPARAAAPATQSKPTAGAVPEGPISHEAVLEAIRKNADPRVGLAFVPRVVRALRRPISEAHRALVGAAKRGAIELRPESGLARLSPEELAACVPGPWDTRLSWVRIL